MCGEASRFPEILRKELQAHISEVLDCLIFENQVTLRKARKFIAYVPKTKDKDDTKYVVETFVEISDAMAEEIGNNEQLSQWRVRLFESNAGVVAG